MTTEFKLRDDATYQAPAEITLVAKDGTLYYPDSVLDAYGEPGPILLRMYAAGDCDTIKWPNPRMANLQHALADDIETGEIDEHTVIRLPDGTVVTPSWAN